MSSVPDLLVSLEESLYSCAAGWLATARAPVCLAGRGTLYSGAQQLLQTLCTRLPALRVASTPGAKGVFHERHPSALGVFGFSGQARAEQLLTQSDVLLVVGSRLWEQSSGSWNSRFARGKVIRIDNDPNLTLMANPDELHLCGDARAILQQLLSRLPEVEVPTPRHLKIVQVAPPTKPEAPEPESSVLIHPAQLMRHLGRLAPGVPVCADAGNAMCWAIEFLERNEPNTFHVSTDWGTMGFALPAALGLSLARRRAGKPCTAIALTGDGSLAMAGGELHTAVELGLPLIIVALNDAGAGMVDAGCRAWFGPDAVASQRYVHPINLAQLAASFGATGHVVHSLEQFDELCQAALDSNAPTLLDVRIDQSAVPRAIAGRVKGLSGDTPNAMSVFED